MTVELQRPTIAVLDYGIGNLRSAQKALAVSGADAILTNDLETIGSADGVVLPGVGAFGASMNALRSSGLDIQVAATIDAKTPFLGICVGMQLLFEGSDESPGVDGLGILPGHIRWLPDTVKRPQMQWNQITVSAPKLNPGSNLDAVGPQSMAEALLAGLDGQWGYFVHSLAAEPSDVTVATAEYGGPITAAVARGRVFATQFHPEKSATAGLDLLRRFVDYCAVTTDERCSATTT